MASSKVIKLVLKSMMMGFGLMVVYNVAFANPSGTTSLATSESMLSAVKTQSVILKSSVLSSADKDVNELNSLKRKTEIQKAVMELKKASNPTGMVTDSQTTAIGVVINQTGSKFATLQFIDGSILDVETGSKVGQYKVSDINMNGVKLINCNGSRCESKLIKRSYPQTTTSNIDVKPKHYTSTPILGSASTEVPPIVSAN